MSDRANGNMAAIADRRVASAVTDEAVDQFVADRANPRLKLLDRVRCERRQQQLLGGLCSGGSEVIGGEETVSGLTSRTTTRREEKCSVS